MNYSSTESHFELIPQLVAKAGLPFQVTFSPKLCGQFGLSPDVDDPGWMDLIWAVRCTLSGCLPSSEFHSTAGKVQLAEFLSMPNGEADPVNRRIAVIRKSADTVHVSLPDELIQKIVLVVEDDTDLGAIAQLLIGRLGVDAIWARDGEEGWNCVQRHKPAVVVTDVDMPRLDGLELCRRIKADPRVRDVPVIVWSGNPAHEQRARQIGAEEFVTKPIEIPALIGILRRFIGG